MTYHPAVQGVLEFFSYEHLPSHLAEVSKDFCDLAHKTAARAPSSPETTIALRKLLEGKDAAVRAVHSTMDLPVAVVDDSFNPKTDVLTVDQISVQPG